MRRTLRPLFVLLWLAPAALLFLGLSQSYQESKIAEDVTQSASLRYRALYIYGITHLAQTDPSSKAVHRDWRGILSQMREARQDLQQRYPEPVQRMDPGWHLFENSLLSSGTVDWATAENMLLRADTMTSQINAIAQARAVAANQWYRIGVLCLGLSVPVAAFQFGQLRRAQRAATLQNEELTGAVQRFQALFNNIPVPCFSYDCNGCITNWNWAAGQTFDHSLSQVQGRPLWEVLSYPERWEAAKAMAAQVCRGEELTDFEWVHPHRDGHDRYFLSSVFPLRDASGEIIGGLAANVDITSRHEATAKLEAASGELSRSNAALQDFAYVASHDLKEPLRKIQTFGGMLQRRLKDASPEQAEHLERILSSAARMQTLIESLMEYSRVTTRGRPPVQVALNTTVREVIQDLEARIFETKGRVITGTLPSVCADAVQMRQLFQNLIGNALKFNAPDRPTLVRVWAREITPDSAEIRVEDNGIGFDAKYAEKIFEVFERLEGRHRYEGTGIGLAICRKIVERHGGTITATSTPGEGATFIITLPIVTGSMQLTQNSVCT